MEQPVPGPNGSEQPKPKKRRRNVPVVIVTAVLCLGLGGAGGVVLGQLADLKDKPAAAAAPAGGSSDEGKATEGKGKGDNAGVGGGKGAPGGGKGGGGKGQAKGQKGGGGGGGQGGGGSGGANLAKIQLTQLVAMLDDLTTKSTIKLSDEQKKQTREALAGLEAKSELTTAEAEKIRDALLKAVEGQKETLLAAGFVWPGQPPPAGAATANPLKDNAFLKSLQTTLGK